jgi:hypothetical protein
METKTRSLPKLNNATDTVLLNNVRKVGELVPSRTSCLEEVLSLLRLLEVLLKEIKIRKGQRKERGKV